MKKNEIFEKGLFEKNLKNLIYVNFNKNKIKFNLEIKIKNIKSL